MTGSTAAVPADARLGVDIGGTKTEAVLLDGGGTIVRQIRIPTGFGPDGVVASTLDAISRLEAPGVPIGIGTPGTVDPVAGTVSHALNLGVERLELGQRVADAVGYGVRVENDVNAAALGAFHLLGRPGTDSIGYLNLGTGLAAGLVLDGRLWRGSRGAAGEIGHILVDPKGPLDLDGQPGGLEVMASGSGIARQWGTGEPNAVSAVLDAADAGDRRAVDIRVACSTASRRPCASWCSPWMSTRSSWVAASAAWASASSTGSARCSTVGRRRHRSSPHWNCVSG